MPLTDLSEDTLAALLLCGDFDREGCDALRPFSPREYAALVTLLRERTSRPGDVLQVGLGGSFHREVGPGGFHVERFSALLGRRDALAVAFEGWESIGLWVMSVHDADYPGMLLTRLGRSAPPILYGAGPRALVGGGGLAIVGSRGADDAALSFAGRVACLCAHHGVTAVSGGSRGVDREALLGALRSGGRAVGVLSDSLARTSTGNEYGDFLRTDRLTLISPYGPDGPFSVGSAMGRNRHTYALANRALVVSCEHRKGGTWAGAVENLRKGWVPLLVRDGEGVPDGNRALVQMGALPVPEGTPGAVLEGWSHDRIAGAATEETRSGKPHGKPGRPRQAQSAPARDVL